MEDRITFKIKKGYYVELLTLKTMELLGSTNSKITQNKSGENVPHLKITEVVLVQCNIASINHQQNSRVLNTFFPSKSFGQLFDTSPKILYFLKTFNSQFSYTEVWLTDQNSKTIDTEDKISINLVIN